MINYFLCLGDQASYIQPTSHSVLETPFFSYNCFWHVFMRNKYMDIHRAWEKKLPGVFSVLSLVNAQQLIL